jgi:hypothetical protein
MKPPSGAAADREEMPGQKRRSQSHTPKARTHNAAHPPKTLAFDPCKPGRARARFRMSAKVPHFRSVGEGSRRARMIPDRFGGRWADMPRQRLPLPALTQRLRDQAVQAM